MAKKRRKKRSRKRRRRTRRAKNPADEFTKMMTGMTRVGVVSAMGLATMSVARAVGT